MSLERLAAPNAVQNYFFFLNYNLFITFFCDKWLKSLDNEQVIILLALLGQDVLAVE